RPIYSANITFDEETGIGKWSEADFSSALREGFRPDRTALRSPMSPMPQLTESDVAAIFSYLRTVPKIRNAVQRQREDADLAKDAPAGERLYFKYACVSCHGESGGEGVADLRLAAQHFGTSDAVKAWIKDAPNIRPGTRM